MRFVAFVLFLIVVLVNVAVQPVQGNPVTKAKAPCDPVYCKKECKKRKFASGVCYNNECICVN